MPLFTRARSRSWDKKIVAQVKTTPMAAASAKLPAEDFQTPPGDEIAGVLRPGTLVVSVAPGSEVWILP